MSSTPKSKSSHLPPPTKSEAAFELALANFGVTLPLSKGESPEALSVSKRDSAEFIEQLFARKHEFLQEDRFRTIGDAHEFYTKIVGVTFEGRQDVVAGLSEGQELALERQADNAFDPNAIAVRFGALQLGYLRKEIAKHLAPHIDEGMRYRARVGSLTGGGARSLGVNIFVQRETTRESSGPGAQERAHADADAVRRALIGDNLMHDAQRAVLARVDAGKNTLAVLGTGRGKSLCFQYPAALRALESNQKTLVIYPLRALANDQYEALMRRFDGFGLRIYRANGSISNDERAELMDALQTGAWDIVLATPEFLQFHHEVFAGPSVPAFVVVDEAHHLHESKHRPAYGRLGELIERLGSPQVLALTATAGNEAFLAIVQALQIESWVVDPTVRANLNIVDARGRKEKETYLRELFSDGGKGIVYTNSRSGAVKVAEALRKSLGDVVGYYHGTLGTPERLEVEQLFRSNVLRVVVATSAFGEGIDLPDVTDVVLYHLNFDFTEFNQQAGRAGRNGQVARIHLLFGDADRRINDFIIDREAPTLPLLREIYKGMRGLASDNVVRQTYVDIARTLELDKANERTISAATRIFEDSGLLATGTDDDGRFIRFLPTPPQKVDLTRSERFAEGEAERENFAKFSDFILSASPQALTNIINRPIYPQNIDLIR